MFGQQTAMGVSTAGARASPMGPRITKINLMLSRVAEIQLHLCMYGCIMIYDDEWWCMIYACSDIQYRFSSNPKQGNSRKSGASKIKPSKDGDGRFPVSKATLGCSPRGVSLEMFSYTSMVSAATGFLTQPHLEVHCKKAQNNSVATLGLVKICGLFLSWVHHWFRTKWIEFGT